MTRPTSGRAGFGSAATLTLGATVPVIATAPTLHPDAELLRLGAELDAEWARQNAYFTAGLGANDKEVMAAMEPCLNLVHRIEPMPARTLEGLCVKARAVQWCCNEGSDDPDYLGCLEDFATTDLKISVSIIRDLLALGSAKA